jgi:hypothetical protein
MTVYLTKVAIKRIYTESLGEIHFVVSRGWGVSYLSWLAGNGNTAIFVIFDGWSSFLYQSPIPCAGVEGRDSSSTGTDPLGKCALEMSNQQPWETHNVHYGQGAQTMLVVVPIF